MYSEKTQRELDRYTRGLVRRQPLWLRKLFDSDKIFFSINDAGNLELCAVEEVSPEKLDHAARLVGKYMDKHPTPTLAKIVVQ